jgi:phospholipid/cholesterol/gamma-HCH transport system substrate-binding protein
MVRGVRVGEVTSVDSGVHGTRVKFAIDRQYEPLHRGASVEVGTRTLFGEAYLRLDRGDLSAPALPSGAAVRTKAAVPADQALRVFGPDTRGHLSSTLQTLGKGLSAPDAADRLHGTVEGMTETVHQLRALTAALHGQETDVAGLVSSGRTVVDALGSREQSLRTIVRSGRQLLGAAAARSQSLENGLGQLGGLTRSANATLSALPPLLSDARPVVSEADAATRAITPALRNLAPASKAGAAVFSRLPTLTDAALPTLRTGAPLMRQLEPVARWLDPTLRNLIPLSQWLAPRTLSYAALLANTASATAHGDAGGKWIRLFMFPGPTETMGLPSSCSTCKNAYPPAGDAANNQPYKPGSFPKLEPYPEP